MKDFLNELWQQQRLLIMAGSSFIILFLILTVLSLIDSQQILGLDRWLKPMKFAGSIAIYLITLAVYLRLLNGYEKSKKFISWSAVILMIGEMFFITMQAARGTTSHFNVSNLFDAAIFTTMGVMISLNTALCAYLTVLYFRAESDLPDALIWGLRLGLIIFILASVEGGYMAAQTGHTVGGADGGAGLPFINWSTENGDLRAAHFVGMHAFQIIPLFSLMLLWLQKRFAFVPPLALTLIFALAYLGIFSWVFVQALRGQPLISKEKIAARENLSGTP